MWAEIFLLWHIYEWFCSVNGSKWQKSVIMLIIFIACKFHHLLGQFGQSFHSIKNESKYVNKKDFIKTNQDKTCFSLLNSFDTNTMKIDKTLQQSYVFS